MRKLIDLEYKFAKYEEDEFGRVDGIILVDKPIGINSHDIVDFFRDKYFQKKVGHAGTLDPFASGLLIILLGKYTKLSDTFLNKNKTYQATLLLGTSTDTLDPEGKILIHKKLNYISDLNLIQNETDSFLKSLSTYPQTVPIFSSVKVRGEKLRILARSSTSFSIDSGIVTFCFENKNDLIIKLPVKEVRILRFKIDEIGIFNKKTKIWNNFQSNLEFDGIFIKITVECTKGTYIRQLAYDIGKHLKTEGMLVELRRTASGDYQI